MSTCSELRSAQRQVHRAIRNLGEGANALVEALTTLGLTVDQAVEQIANAVPKAEGCK